MAKGWYVVHTYSGYENKVEKYIRKMIENDTLEGAVFDVKVPAEDVVEVKDGKRRVLSKKFLPGYILLEMDLPDLIYRLRQIAIQKGIAPTPLKKLNNWLYRFFDSGKIAGPNHVSEERTDRLKKLAETSGVNVYKKCIEEIEEK